MDFLDKIDSYAAESNKIAQIYRDSILTYKELKEKSDALACYIIEKYGQDKTPILIYGHKQHEMLISFLACSKAGHAYIPVDVTFPSARVNDIIESSGSKLFINIGELEYDSKTLEILNVNEVNNIMEKYKGETPDRKYRVEHDDNYYILYTSGSTGKPKGVQITKGCLATFMEWFLKYAEVSQGKDVIIDQPSYSFDLSVVNVYVGLYKGNTLYTIDKKMVESFQELYDHLGKSNIATWVATPSFTDMCMLDDKFNRELLPNLERMIFSGEVLPKKLAHRLFERFPGVKIVNGYGPTEATVFVDAVEVTPEIMSTDKSIPIAFNMEGGTLLVIDEAGKEVAVGEKGEFIIIGDTVSPGYYNNEEITKKVFFKVEENGVIKRGYKTGDLVYKDVDGYIYYCGRKDFQIKLNGYRMEIEDIENNIRKLELINNAVIFPVYKDDKVANLTAFVTLKEKNEEKEFKMVLKIKEELKRLIPAYMVPKNIKIKEQLPTNSNGKVDRKKLMEELR